MKSNQVIGTNLNLVFPTKKQSFIIFLIACITLQNLFFTIKTAETPETELIKNIEKLINASESFAQGPGKTLQLETLNKSLTNAKSDISLKDTSLKKLEYIESELATSLYKAKQLLAPTQGTQATIQNVNAPRPKQIPVTMSSAQSQPVSEASSSKLIAKEPIYSTIAQAREQTAPPRPTAPKPSRLQMQISEPVPPRPTAPKPTFATATHTAPPLPPRSIASMHSVSPEPIYSAIHKQQPPQIPTRSYNTAQVQELVAQGKTIPVSQAGQPQTVSLATQNTAGATKSPSRLSNIVTGIKNRAIATAQAAGHGLYATGKAATVGAVKTGATLVGGAIGAGVSVTAGAVGTGVALVRIEPITALRMANHGITAATRSIISGTYQAGKAAAQTVYNTGKAAGQTVYNIGKAAVTGQAPASAKMMAAHKAATQTGHAPAKPAPKSAKPVFKAHR